MDLLLGLDQGATKTHALICDLTGRALAMGSAPGCIHTVGGMQAALAAMGAAADEALAKIGQSRKSIFHVSGGLTGIDYPYEKTLLSKEVAAYFGTDPARVDNDCIGALFAGAFTTPAAVCCVGTGINVGGIGASGEPEQFGNYANGPFGGGGTIGQAAIQYAFDSHIGKEPPSLLLPMLIEATGSEDADDMLLRRYRKKVIAPSRLCPVVFRAAESGDEAAIGILNEHAESWAKLTMAMLKRLNVHSEESPTVVLSGSVFKGRPAVHIQRFRSVLTKRYPRARLISARFEPVVGGAAMGLMQFGAEGWRERLAQSAGALGLEREGKELPNE